MDLVHSLWTKPMLRHGRGVSLKRHLRTTLWCHASSVAFAAMAGEPIVLYGDRLAQSMLSYLPYSEIRELGVPDDVPTELWAAGKFYALKRMNLGDIHIDGDVFLKTPELIRMMREGLAENDLIIQSVEDAHNTSFEWYEIVRGIIRRHNMRLIYGCTADMGDAYNCGVVGLNNQGLKDKYLECYFYSLRQIQERPEILRNIRATENCIMDLVLEQQHLYQLSAGYKVYNLLGSGKEAYQKAVEVGYQHVLGSSKWEDLRKIKQQLKRVNPEIYEMTKIKEKYLLKAL